MFNVPFPTLNFELGTLNYFLTTYQLF
jgi:hypothetical protein